MSASPASISEAAKTAASSEVRVLLRRMREISEVGLAMARDARDSRVRRRSARESLAEHPQAPLTSEERVDARSFLAQFSPRYRNLEWHQLLRSGQGGFDAGYVPDDLFFVAIEPALNARDRETVVSDKNRYDRLDLSIRVPQPVARIVRGRLVGPDYRLRTMAEVVARAAEDAETEVVLKPTLSDGGATGVQFLAPQDLPRVIEPLLDHNSVHDDWVIQRVIRQSSELAELNQTSVNTLKIMTYRSAHGIKHLSSVVRMGRDGSRVDNARAPSNQIRDWGVMCGVDSGVLRPVGHIKYQAVESHPDSGVRFAGYRIPSWQEAVDACIDSHDVIPAMDLISWDVAIDNEQRPTLIEFNTYQQGLELHQLENGSLPQEIVAEWAQRASFRMIGGLVVRRHSRDS